MAIGRERITTMVRRMGIAANYHGRIRQNPQSFKLSTTWLSGSITAVPTGDGGHHRCAIGCCCGKTPMRRHRDASQGFGQPLTEAGNLAALAQDNSLYHS